MFVLLCLKEEILKRMAAEFQGEITDENILLAMDVDSELAGDEQALAAPGIAVV